MRYKTYLAVMAVVLVATIGIAITLNSNKVLAPSPEHPGIFVPNDLPELVAQTYQQLYQSAQNQDWDAISTLADPTQLRYTFGYDPDNNPVAYWQQYEPDILSIVPAILDQPYDIIELGDYRIYTWPAVFTKEASQWTDDDLTALQNIASPEEIVMYQEFGGYIGYRIGISDDGTWSYLIAGD
jgi:hypothetical protein